MGHLQLPTGKKIAVNLGTDFDAQALWLGAFNRPSPASGSSDLRADSIALLTWFRSF